MQLGQKMRRERGARCLGQMRDPPPFADAADPPDIGLDDVHGAALQERLDLMARRHRLPGRDPV